MRILLANPNTSLAVTDTIAAVARAAAAPGTEIVTATAAFGARLIGTRTESAVADHATLELLAQYAPGCDAAIIGASFDNAVRAAREMLPIPVVGMTEAALHVAALTGGAFGVVLVNARVAPLLREQVSASGFGASFAGVRVLPGSVLEVLQRPDAMADQVASAAHSLIEHDGAEIIVLIGAIMGALPGRVQRRVPVPVIEGLSCAVALAESLVRLRIPRARAGSYAPLPAREQTGIGPALMSQFG